MGLQVRCLLWRVAAAVVVTVFAVVVQRQCRYCSAAATGGADGGSAADGGGAGDAQAVLDTLRQGVAFYNAGDVKRAASLYKQVLAMEPQHPDALHLMGITTLLFPEVLDHSSGDDGDLAERSQSVALAYVQAAVDAVADAPRANFFNSLGEVHRHRKDWEAAVRAYSRALELNPTNRNALNNLADAYLYLKRYGDSLALYSRLAELEPLSFAAANGIGHALAQLDDYDGAANAFKSMLRRGIVPDSDRAQIHISVATQEYSAGHLQECIQWCKDALALNQSTTTIREAYLTIGAAQQQLGKFDDAVEAYNRVLQVDAEEPRALNNLGAVLQLRGKFEEALAMLTRALEAQPNHAEAMINLGVYYSTRSAPGDTKRARELFLQAYGVKPLPEYRLRAALVLATTVASKEELQQERARYNKELASLLQEALADPQKALIRDLVQGVEWLPFGITYHGLDDRVQQETLARLFVASSMKRSFIVSRLQAGMPSSDEAWTWSVKRSTVDGGLEVEDAALGVGVRRIRVGFFSKYFTDNHAHGQLLQGIMAGLSRDYFEVVVLRLLHPTLDVSEPIKAAADTIIDVPLHLDSCLQVVEAAMLDVIIFADMLSEPMAFTVALHRLAPVQVAFWGNPDTTGHEDTIDYFMSGDVMEVATGGQFYSEQLVRLQGQAIAYDPYSVPDLQGRDETRRLFGIPEDATVYTCFHSVYKLHPDFDAVIAGILKRSDANTRIVFLAARRHQHMEIVLERWRRTLPPGSMDRIMVVPRQLGSDAFMKLSSIADVALVPFPFGGSKTSLDTIAMGIPTVTMPTQFLRGRMTLSYYISMGMADECCVANSPEHYVDMAVRLATNTTWRTHVSSLLRERVHTVWKRREVVLRWQLFLMTAVGYNAAARQRVRNELYAVDKADEYHGGPSHSIDTIGLRDSGGLVGTRSFAPSLEASGRLLPRGSSDTAANVGGQQLAPADTTASPPSSSSPASPPTPVPSSAARAATAETGDSALEHALAVVQLEWGVGVDLFQQGDLQGAEEHLQHALAVIQEQRGYHPSNETLAAQAAGLHSDIGAILKEQWRLGEAEEHFNAALSEYHPTSAVHNNLGVLLVDLGRHEDAVLHFRRALELDSSERSSLYNLGRALQTLGRITEMAETYRHYLGIPASGLEQVVTLALVAPPPVSHSYVYHSDAVLTHFGSLLIAEGKLDPRVDLGALLASFREPDTLKAVNALAVALADTNQVGRNARHLVRRLAAFRRSFLVPGTCAYESGANECATQACSHTPANRSSHFYAAAAANGDGVHVIMQFYESKSPQRRRELAQVLRANLDNEFVSAVHVLLEHDVDLTAVVQGTRHPHRMAKLRTLPVHRRLSFAMALAYANERLAGHVVALANADIFFDHTLELVLRHRQTLLLDTVLALLRWDVTPGGALRWTMRADSQDAWVFEAPLSLPPGLLPSFGDLTPAALGSPPRSTGSVMDFDVGLPRCDNRIAAVLVRAGLRVRNPSLDIVAAHVQASQHGQRPHSYGGPDAVPGEAMLVLLDEAPYT